MGKSHQETNSGFTFCFAMTRIPGKPSMPARKYMEENDSDNILDAKRSAGVAPGLNLRERLTCTPPPSMIKAAHSGFETQR